MLAPGSNCMQSDEAPSRLPALGPHAFNATPVPRGLYFQYGLAFPELRLKWFH
jgi:hypothetical protein